MQALRLITWIIVAAAFALFIYMNYGQPVPVRFWPLSGKDNLLVEWPVAVIALAFFLLGFIPTWLVQRAIRWRLQRRISGLEAAARSVAVAPPPAPAATSVETTLPADPVGYPEPLAPEAPLEPRDDLRP